MPRRKWYCVVCHDERANRFCTECLRSFRDWARTKGERDTIELSAATWAAARVRRQTETAMRKLKAEVMSLAEEVDHLRGELGKGKP